MPTTYTHDKFGKDVYKKLPEHIKAVIRKERVFIGSVSTDRIFSFTINRFVCHKAELIK